jgi:hypothetical protein
MKILKGLGTVAKGLAKATPIGLAVQGGKAIARGRKARDQRAIQQANAQSSRDERLIRDLRSQRPTFQSTLTSPEFEQQRAFAFSNQESPVFAAQRARIETQGRQALDDLSADQAGQQANAYSQLAMGGGLSSGARERVASQGLESNLAARQRARSGTSDQLAQAGLEEARQRMALQTGIADARAKDIAQQNEFNMNAYQEMLGSETALAKARSERDIAAKNRKRFLGIF